MKREGWGCNGQQVGLMSLAWIVGSHAFVSRSRKFLWLVAGGTAGLGGGVGLAAQLASRLESLFSPRPTIFGSPSERTPSRI